MQGTGSTPATEGDEEGGGAGTSGSACSGFSRGHRRLQSRPSTANRYKTDGQPKACMRGPQTITPTALPTSNAPKTAVTALARSFLHVHFRVSAAASHVLLVTQEIWSGQAGRKLSSLDTLCRALHSERRAYNRKVHMGTCESLDDSPCAMIDTYSGTSLAMTLVADDGARPSPSPTCNCIIPY